MQNHVALEDNNTLMDQYLSLNEEKSRILNFSNAAEQQLCTESVKTLDTLERFYENVSNGLLPKCVKEMELLKQTYNLDKLEVWDVPYYINKYRESKENFDKSAFSKYFPTKYTIKQMIKLYEGFFGLEFELEHQKATNDMGLWHKDVVVNKKNS